MNSNSNTNTGSNKNDGRTSTTAVNVDGQAGSSKRPPKAPRNYQKTPKVAVTKYARGKIPARLIMVKELVEAQPTKELQSQLFAIAESNLTGLTKIVKKESGAAKFDSDEEYIPSSCRR